MIKKFWNWRLERNEVIEFNSIRSKGLDITIRNKEIWDKHIKDLTIGDCIGFSLIAIFTILIIIKLFF